MFFTVKIVAALIFITQHKRTHEMRKNILILAHSHESQFIDIYNQYTRLFDKDQYLVTVMYMTAAHSADIKKKTLAENVIFAGIDKKKLRFLKLGVVKTLIQLCRQRRYEIVICHRYKPSYLMMIVAKFCNIPRLVFVMHAIGTMRSRRRQWFIAAMLQKNMMFAGVSNAVRDDLRKDLTCLPPERIVTLYNAIDVDLTEPQLLSRKEAREKLGIEETIFAFGHVGRLEANKDQATLLKAFSLLASLCPQAMLYIVGSGVKEAELKAQAASYQLSDRIIFTGRLPYAFQYMKAFDCFVLSSSQEAFGRVLLEAMLAKVPVIGTTAFGIPEVIGNAGTLVPARNAEQLCKAMHQMYGLSASELRSQGQKAYQHVLQNFSLPRFYLQFHEHVQLR